MRMFIYVEREIRTIVELRTAVVGAEERSVFYAHKLVQSTIYFLGFQLNCHNILSHCFSHYEASTHCV